MIAIRRNRAHRDGVLSAAIADYRLAIERRRFGEAAEYLRIALKAYPPPDCRPRIEAALHDLERFLAACSDDHGRQNYEPEAAKIILGRTLRHFGVTREELCDIGRNPRVVMARCVVWTLLRKYTLMSLPEVARYTGRPNHSTVHTGIARLARILRNGPMHTMPWGVIDLQRCIDEIEAPLKGRGMVEET